MLHNVARAAAGCAAVVFALFAYAFITAPDVRPLATRNPASTAFMDIRDQEARDKGKVPHRTQHWVSYAHIAQPLKRAVVIAEDDAFWQHEGVDFEQIKESLELDWARGELLRGASTITQQLAKNLYLSPSRNPVRKYRELVIARRLEAALSKQRIFEIYLNVIEWGDGIYGAEAASRAYFSEPAASLNASDAALLAGAIVNPRLLNPAHPTPRLRARQQLILHRMDARNPPPLPAVTHATAPDVGAPPTSPSTVEPVSDSSDPADDLR